MVGLAFLLSAELPALGLQLQAAELPLVERFYGALRWKNGVEVIAVPLHPALIEVLAVFHHDEAPAIAGGRLVYALTARLNMARWC